MGRIWVTIGIVTPIGGLALIAGWLLLALGAWRHGMGTGT
jgi:uncharacterized membrane protein YgdD (TMEM256/DUF423 family)